MSQPLLQNQINPYDPPNYDKKVQDDIRASFAAPSDVNQLKQQKQSYHLKALIGSLIFWIAVPTFIVMVACRGIEMSGESLTWICIGFYILYLIISICCNPLFNYLKNIQHGGKFQQQYQKIKRIQGYFIFKVQCYHYQTRHHTRTVSDGNGGTRTQHYTTTQKVVTYRNTQTLFPTKTKDDSGDVDQVRALTSIIFVHYMVNYRFVDEVSRQIFDKEWYNFKSRNKFDVHQDYNYNYQVPGLVERMTFFVGDKQPKWFKFLVIWTIFGLIWPFSMWVESRISRFNIYFLKILTMGYKH